jgi:DNA transformation protein
MARRSEFVEHLLDLLRPLGVVQARAMFGGWGLYLEGRIFALVAFETLYIKADHQNRADFTARGLAPFRYEMRPGKWNEMSYYTAPVEALEDSAALCAWAAKGIAAARRA